MPCIESVNTCVKMDSNLLSTKLTQTPMVAELASGRKVIVDYMTDHQLAESYCMIKEAAEYGDGYGIDEFGSEEEFRMEIGNSYCFAVTCKESGYLLAGFIIAVSKFYRGQSAMADPFVIVRRSERKQGLGEFTLRKAVEFATKLGFFGMYVDTFSSNIGVLRIIEKIGGFQKVGILPVGGKLQNGQIVSSVIFIKYLVDLDVS